jgi:hypothetical protein
MYGSEAVLPTDLAFGAPRIKHYEEGSAKETCMVDLDNIEEHRVAVLMRHTCHEQQLCHYHDRNMRERSFNVGDLVMWRIQDTKGMHKLSAPWEGPFVVMEVIWTSDLPPPVGRWPRLPEHLEHRAPASLLSLEDVHQNKSYVLSPFVISI